MPTVEATQVKCPECGARLHVAKIASVAKCEYCGNVFSLDVQGSTPGP